MWTTELAPISTKYESINELIFVLHVHKSAVFFVNYILVIVCLKMNGYSIFIEDCLATLNLNYVIKVSK